jgi:hypothetical protein
VLINRTGVPQSIFLEFRRFLLVTQSLTIAFSVLSVLNIDMEVSSAIANGVLGFTAFVLVCFGVVASYGVKVRCRSASFSSYRTCVLCATERAAAVALVRNATTAVPVWPRDSEYVYSDRIRNDCWHCVFVVRTGQRRFQLAGLLQPDMVRMQF